MGTILQINLRFADFETFAVGVLTKGMDLSLQLLDLLNR